MEGRRADREPDSASAPIHLHLGECEACGGRGIQVVDWVVQPCPVCEGERWLLRELDDVPAVDRGRGLVEQYRRSG